MVSTNLRAWITAILREVTGIEPHARYECVPAPQNLTDLYHSVGDLQGISVIVVCSEYSFALADQLERAKYTGDHRALAVFEPSLQEGLILLLSAIPWGVQPDITFIPMGINRYISRGFNQTHVLARILEKTRGLRVTQNFWCPWSSGHQAHKTKEARKLSQPIFYKKPWAKEVISGSVIIIDDVISTGATLAAYSGVLRALGYTQIYALILARKSQSGEKI